MLLLVCYQNDENSADGNTNNGSGSYSTVLNKIEKFSGKGDMDFSSWLRTFERACTIAQKTDDLIKGQLLMLCLTGQAIAAAEQLEEECSMCKVIMEEAATKTLPLEIKEVFAEVAAAQGKATCPCPGS